LPQSRRKNYVYNFLFDVAQKTALPTYHTAVGASSSNSSSVHGNKVRSGCGFNRLGLLNYEIADLSVP
jgi:hypothetical protein